MARVLIAIPTDGGVHENVSMWAAYMLKHHNCDYITSNGRPADFNRNKLVKYARQKGYTHIFLIDADTEPMLDALEKLLALDVPIATGCYPCWGEDRLQWALTMLDSNRKHRLLDKLEKEPFEVDGAGAGCLLIRKDAFEKLKWPWFKWNEFENGDQLSEDLYFCDKARKSKLEIIAHPGVICNHHKQINLTKLMKEV